ncbi:HECAM protein, partial [Circaetus pectoralis]|nr:HECAM protein [Circaetus pectoralis]
PCSGRRLSLICPFPSSAGGNLGVLVQIHQDSINGTEGQSVLLPVSYRFDGAPRLPVKIVWNSSNKRDELVTCSVLNCSLGAEGAPSSCSAQTFYHITYRGRTKLFPENGSLLLSDLRLSDSGVYSVTFSPSTQNWHITLTVHEQCSTSEHPGTELGGGGGTATRIPCYVFGGCYCFILLFLQLFFHL